MHYLKGVGLDPQDLKGAVYVGPSLHGKYWN